jgi:hypothetical protein
MSNSNGMSFDLKKAPSHHMDLSAHSALSHYTSQMGMKAAMVEASRYGGHVGQGPPTPSAAGAPPRCQRYKMFVFLRRRCCGKVTRGICTWQAFTAESNVCK